MLFVTPRVRKEQADYLKSMTKAERRSFWGDSIGTLKLESLLSITYRPGPEGEEVLAEAKRIEAEMMAWYAAEKSKGRKRRRRGRRDPLAPM